MVMKKKPKLEEEEVHRVAQFLLINSEAIRGNHFNGSLSLIYFLFEYSRFFEKEDYSLFAFEHFETVLKQELSKIDKNSYDSYSGLAEIGWSLMKFIEEGYFESDDLEEILSMIDKIVFYEVEMLSRTSFELIYLPQLLFLGVYLEERSNLLVSHNDYLLETKEYLLISFFEIGTNIGNIPIENKELLKLCRLFYKNGMSNVIISHFCIEGLKKIEELLPSNNDSNVGHNLFDNLKTDSIEIVDYLYKNKKGMEDRSLKKLILLGIRMINYNKIKKNKSFESYLEEFNSNPRSNEKAFI